MRTYIRYHDIDKIPDFLLLESVYRNSMHTQWKEGDRFCSFIEDKYWFGVIEKKEAFRLVW